MFTDKKKLLKTLFVCAGAFSFVHASVPNAPGSYLGVSKLGESNTSVRFSFKNNSNNEDGFYLSVYNYNDNSHFATIDVNATDEEYGYANVTGLTCNKMYKAIAVAYNSDGNSSDSDLATFNIESTFGATCSPSSNETTPNQPGPYIGVTSLDNSPSSVRVNFKDNSDNEDGFRIFDGAGINVTIPANDRSVNSDVYVNLTGLTCTQLYGLQAVSYKGALESLPTPIRTFRIESTFSGIDCGGPAINLSPIADAGDDKTFALVNNGISVLLDGSQSSDPDGDSITYAWSFISKPAGSIATLSDSSLVNPTFIADVEGNYTIQLIVNDGQENSVASTVLISILPSGQNTPPTILLNGQPVVTIVKGLPYTEQGAIANDNEDGDITANIITSGTVNTDIVGDYTIDYSIVDSGGLQAQTTRIVKVVVGHINNAFNDPAVNSKHNVHAVGLDRNNGTLKLILDGGNGNITFPYIWVANSGEGTISLLSTETGVELGRYRTGPTSWTNPSRTTVDQDGNVWVGNRSENTITKIGLNAWDQCIDVDNNGQIDTSTGATDVLPWGEDECLLQYVTLAKDGLSANNVRLVAVDADNNVFAGGSSSNALFKVNGATGVIMNAVTTKQNHYGGVVDNQGNIWSMPPSHNGTVQKISHDMSSKEIIQIGHAGYGIAIDKYGKVWTTELWGDRFSTFNPSDPTGTLSVFHQTAHSGAQGVATDSRGNIFIAGNLWGNTVGEYRQTFDIGGNFTGVEFVKNHAVQNGPTGVAVDAKGKVWASNQGSNSVSRIDPITEVVDHFPVGSGPYNYSDMTGNVVRNITEKTGTWEATFNGEDNDYSWNKVRWRLKEALPAETTIKVFAKAANETISLAGKSYIEIQNGIPFNLTGQYLKIKIELVSKNLTNTPEVVEIELF